MYTIMTLKYINIYNILDLDETLELQDINFVQQTVNEDQLKAFGFLGQWMIAWYRNTAPAPQSLTRIVNLQRHSVERFRLLDRNFRDSKQDKLAEISRILSGSAATSFLFFICCLWPDFLNTFSYVAGITL
jgi:hypothetical protein